MILRTTGKDIAEQALTGGYTGIPYDKLDCQGFVEQVLKDLGVRKQNGTPYNWRGSNSMWRNYVMWKGTIVECKQKFGEIPTGAFMFIIKNDGGEKEHGYTDDQGNASHVGIYIYGETCMDSQPHRGVFYVSEDIFTHVALMNMVDYTNEPLPEPKTELEAIHILRDDTSSDEECLEALKTLTKYLKGV